MNYSIGQSRPCRDCESVARPAECMSGTSLRTSHSSSSLRQRKKERERERYCFSLTLVSILYMLNDCRLIITNSPLTLVNWRILYFCEFEEF